MYSLLSFGVLDRFAFLREATCGVAVKAGTRAAAVGLLP
jgi:hypothetical protein